MKARRCDDPEHALQRHEGHAGTGNLRETRALAAKHRRLVFRRHPVRRGGDRQTETGRPRRQLQDRVVSFRRSGCRSPDQSGGGGGKRRTQKVAASPEDVLDIVGCQEILRRSSQLRTALGGRFAQAIRIPSQP